MHDELFLFIDFEFDGKVKTINVHKQTVQAKIKMVKWVID